MSKRALFSGTAASDGIGVAPVFTLVSLDFDFSDGGEFSPDTELERFSEAQKRVGDEIRAMREDAYGRHDDWTVKIFDSHLFLISDPELQNNVVESIKENRVSAESALLSVRDSIVLMLESLGDRAMAERSSDIRDLTDRMLAVLTNQSLTDLSGIESECIIAARDLSPLDTAGLNTSLVKGIITETGGYSCHTAIVARTLGIPAVTGIHDLMSGIEPGAIAVVNGTEGEVILNPGPEGLKAAEEKEAISEKVRRAHAKWRDRPTLTMDGESIILGAHLGSLRELDSVLGSGADGIGLFRTEFLFLGKEGFPDEQAQFEVYREVLEKTAPMPVVIRTMDIGGDKMPAGYSDLKPEANPFLGVRGIRYSLANPEVFRVQLRALLRASVYGNLKLMFPMIAVAEELKSAREIVEDELRRLRASGCEVSDNFETGAMIEVPAAALSADELVRHSDFFSIGTNDLVQYTMAADRLNDSVSHLYRPLHPAVLRLIRMTAEAAAGKGVWTGVCGEMAGNIEAVPILLGLGVTELSVAAPRIPMIRELISGLSLKELREQAADILSGFGNLQ